MRKDLIVPVGAGEDRFRFGHQLIRDAAYEGMPKELRADLHERFADRLEAHPPAVPVVDELLGYHLERAVLLRRELGEADATTAELAARASTSLSAAGTAGRPARRPVRRERAARARDRARRAPTTSRAASCCRRSAPRCSKRVA